jgi:Niemann-Pick C1 protein
MGPSVFHVFFSTFLAIIVLAWSDSRVFIVAFKMWIGIIFFGMANGFMLLPVLLSLFGPINKLNKSKDN